MSKWGAEIDEFVEERNAMLERGDLDELIAFNAKWNPEAPIIPRDVAEVTLHKCRTAALGLPLAVRRASHDWLISRGLSSFDPSLKDKPPAQ